MSGPDNTPYSLNTHLTWNNVEKDIVFWICANFRQKPADVLSDKLIITIVDSFKLGILERNELLLTNNPVYLDWKKEPALFQTHLKSG